MPLPLSIPLSWNTAKLSIFYLLIGWIYYDITMEQQEQIVHKIVQVHKIKFKNAEHEYVLKANATECNDKTLLIAVSSASDAIQKRTAIRNTWLKNINSDVIYRFFVDFSLNEDVTQEAQIYGDVISTDIFESSETLAFKTYAIIKWQQEYCSSPKYIFRISDDMIADISRLQYWIENEFDHLYTELDGKVIFCRTNEIIDSNIKYKIKWSEKNGVEYCEGSAYLLSSKAAHLMLDQTAKNNMVTSFEDIMFTGVLAESASVQRFHKPKHFSSKAIKTKCGCDKNGTPYLICVEDITKQNSTIKIDFKNIHLFNYSNQVNEFLDKICQNTSDVTSVEYFKHCVAHSG